MRTIKLGGREIQITGSPLTPLYYKREFGSTLSGDLIKTQAEAGDATKFDDVAILQMIWAMEKTTEGGKLDDFETWLGKIEWLDLSEVYRATLLEAQDATFREDPEKSKPEPKPKQKAK